MKSVALFDLDGTLVDADHLHFEAWKHMFAPHGVNLTIEDYRTRVMGAPNPLIMERMVPSLDAEAALKLTDAKEAMFRELFVTEPPAKGLPAFLDWLQAHGVPIGVVTNAPRANAEHQLRGIGLASRFEIVVIGEELPHSKPHPLPYLTGLQRLGGDAALSLGFEDSLSGIAAGKAAGLTMIGLATGLSEERLLAEGVALAVPDYEDARLIPFVSRYLGLAELAPR